MTVAAYIERPEIGWRSASTATGTPVSWVDCPWCWKQGRILVASPFGLVLVTCPNCLGIGEVVRAAL